MVPDEITIRNVLDVFFRMETAEDLFSRKSSDDTSYWDILRRDVYLTLHTLHGGPFVLPRLSDPPSLRSLAKDLAKPLLNLVSRRYLQSRSPRYVFITGQRVRDGDRLIDNICDPLYEPLAGDAVAVELMNKSAIHPRQLLLGGPTRIPPVAVPRTRDLAEARVISDRINASVQKYFGMRHDFTQLVGDLLFMHRTTLAYYRQMLAAFRPRAIVCVNNGTLSGMFAAAREHDVPAVELQHGASTRHTIIWSYPESIGADHPGLSLPTAYLTYSDYWTRNTHFPVRMMRSIGNDSSYQERNASDGNGVLMISSYMYREALLELAIHLADRDPVQQIHFKLHPHEYDRRTEITAALGGRSNITVVGAELDFSELFRRCGYVVGVQSSVVYTALQAGCRVCLLKRSNYFWHDDIFTHVELFDTADELHEITHRPRDAAKPCDLPEFSRRLDRPAFMQALDDLQAITRCRTAPTP